VVKVLARKKLVVDPRRSRAARGSRLGVEVRGLVLGEHVMLKLRGKVVKQGLADKNGRFFRYVRVTGPVGRATFTALGEFPVLRRGSETIRVVR
jgi:hypothetical protein